MNSNSRSRVLASLLVGLALSAACVHPELEPAERIAATPDAPLLPEELEVAYLINEYRALRGFSALQIDPTLCRAARWHSRNMARTGRLAHALDGRGPGDRAAAVGFRGPIAENCAAGSGAAPRIYFDLWVDSAAHRANLVVFKEGVLGVGFAGTSAGDERYLTAMFGATPESWCDHPLQSGGRRSEKRSESSE
jgi:uncharacterized protein YkwD